ncbi:MAG: FKBP-type peptidyl-prolyl cis-trans isomerase [Candidatus Poseidoniales archaeon]|jgi:FKBP-type peptidyl-prolyl cis-trans isomerase SlyD
MADEKLEKNMIASVHYTGTLPESGEVFDSSEGRDPLVFLVGHQQMIPGFETEMLGATVGERREFTLAPEDAYGMPSDENVIKVPRDEFGDIDLVAGMTLMSDSGPFTVQEVSDKEVTADFNHKLSGESLTFSVEVVELRSANEAELAHGHVHGPGGAHD